MITLDLGIIKRVHTRRVSYTIKEVYRVLNNLGCKHEIKYPATMIIQVKEQFNSKEAAIARRKEITNKLKLIKAVFRFDITGHNDHGQTPVG